MEGEASGDLGGGGGRVGLGGGIVAAMAPGAGAWAAGTSAAWLGLWQMCGPGGCWTWQIGLADGYDHASGPPHPCEKTG